MSTHASAQQNHHGAVPPASAKKPSRAPRILMIIGAVILLLSLIAGGIAGFAGISKAVSIGDEVTVIQGSGSFQADAGERVIAYKPEGAPIPECAVNSPDGSQIETGLSASYTFSDDGQNWESFDAITAPTAGEYQVQCPGGDTIAMGPPVSVGGILAGVGGILTAVFGGGLGLLLLVAGLIWHFVSRGKR